MGNKKGHHTLFMVAVLGANKVSHRASSGGDHGYISMENISIVMNPFGQCPKANLQ